MHFIFINKHYNTIVQMPTLISQSNVDPETLSLLKGSFFEILR